MQIYKDIKDEDIINDINTIFANTGYDESYTTNTYQIVDSLGSEKSFVVPEKNEAKIVSENYQDFYKSLPTEW